MRFPILRRTTHESKAIHSRLPQSITQRSGIPHPQNLPEPGWHNPHCGVDSRPKDALVKNRNPPHPCFRKNQGKHAVRSCITRCKCICRASILSGDIDLRAFLGELSCVLSGRVGGDLFHLWDCPLSMQKLFEILFGQNRREGIMGFLMRRYGSIKEE